MLSVPDSREISKKIHKREVSSYIKVLKESFFSSLCFSYYYLQKVHLHIIHNSVRHIKTKTMQEASQWSLHKPIPMYTLMHSLQSISLVTSKIKLINYYSVDVLKWEKRDNINKKEKVFTVFPIWYPSTPAWWVESVQHLFDSLV